MQNHSTPTKRDSRGIDDLQWGDLGDYYPAHEHTPARLAAWEESRNQFDAAVLHLGRALEKRDTFEADAAVGIMEAVEKKWGDAPMARRAAEIVGVYFAKHR